jgi:hypothetical protein
MSNPTIDTPFRELDADGRRKRVAELIRDLWPHRQSEKAAEVIESLYLEVPEALADIAVDAMDTYDVIRREISSWMPGDDEKIRAMTEGLMARIFAHQAVAEEAAAHPAGLPTALTDYQAEIYEINVANGWFESERTFDDDMALLHSEISEMLEAYRDHGIEDVTPEHETEPGTRGFKPLPKREGCGSEGADVVVRALDTAQRCQISIPWRSLQDIPPSELYEDGKTIGRHIAILHWLVAKIDYEYPDLVPVLSYLTTVFRHLEIDLTFELERKIAYNRTRGHRHGGKRV